MKRRGGCGWDICRPFVFFAGSECDLPRIATRASLRRGFSIGNYGFLVDCLNDKHRMGCPKRDGMNRRRSYWIRWSMRQLQPVLDIGAAPEPVVKRGSEVA